MGKPLADMQGQVFGRLTVLERDSFSNGKTQVAVAWIAELGLTDSQVYKRIKRGWSDEEVLLGRPTRFPNATLQAITQP
jgi:hypothetical protein